MVRTFFVTIAMVDSVGTRRQEAKKFDVFSALLFVRLLRVRHDI